MRRTDIREVRLRVTDRQTDRQTNPTTVPSLRMRARVNEVLRVLLGLSQFIMIRTEMKVQTIR